MVLTCAVPLTPRLSHLRTEQPKALMSRRSLLAAFGAGAVGLAVSACTSAPPPAKTAAVAAATSPLGPLYTETLTLLSMYDQAIAASAPRTGILGPLREQTRQHAVALAALMGAVAPSIPAGPDPSGVPMPPPSGPATATPSTPASIAPSTGQVSGAPSGIPSDEPSSGTPSEAPSSGVPSSGPTSLLPASTRAPLIAAEKAAQADVTTACLTAPADQVAVLASIAAARATHVAALA